MGGGESAPASSQNDISTGGAAECDREAAAEQRTFGQADATARGGTTHSPASQPASASRLVDIANGQKDAFGFAAVAQRLGVMRVRSAEGFRGVRALPRLPQASRTSSPVRSDSAPTSGPFSGRRSRVRSVKPVFGVYVLANRVPRRGCSARQATCSRQPGGTRCEVESAAGLHAPGRPAGGAAARRANLAGCDGSLCSGARRSAYA